MPSPENLIVYDAITRKFLRWFRPEYDFGQHPNLKDNNADLREILLAIQPDNLCRYFKELAYGVQVPGPDDRPTLKRANGILFDKKAISWYMPRNNMEWDLVDEKGNPTKSPALNTLIKQITRWELRGEGKPGSEKRPLEYNEYMNILKINLEHANFQNATLHGLWTWTFQLVCRVDDACNLKYGDIKYIPGYPDCLFIEVVRSKNINSKKQVSRQVILGSMDPYLCALAGLTAHLIERLEDRADPSNLILEWMFTENGTTGRDDQLKTDYSRAALKRIIALDEFEAMGSVPDIGTHSFRKCPCTYAQRRGSTKDDAEGRGRWALKKNGEPRHKPKRQVDTYTSNLMPYPDAKVSEQLCGPRGPCTYKVRQHADTIDNEEFLREVVPGLYDLPTIHESHKRLFAIIALYLATTDSILVNYEFKIRVMMLIHDTFDVAEGYDLSQLVVKQQILIIRDSNDSFRMQEIDGAPGAENVQHMNVQDLHNEILGLTAEVRHIKQMME